MSEKKAKVAHVPTKGRERMLCLHYLSVLKPEGTDPVCPSGRSTFHVQTLLSVSIDQIFQKPALPPPQSIGLASSHVKGIDAGALLMAPC